MTDPTTTPSPDETLRAAVLRAILGLTWPDGARDWMPTTKVAGMLTDAILAALPAAAPDEREATCDAQALDDLDFIAPVGHQVYEATETEPAECTDECTGCMVDRIRDVLLAALAARPAPVVSGEAVIEYVAKVISDPKYGHDAEWLRLNLHASHLRQIATRGLTVADEGRAG